MHKIFSSSPAIPWKIGCSSRVIPQIPSDLWNKILSENENIEIIAHGGLLESFYSLSILEILNFYYPKTILYWNGQEKFFDVANINGLAKLSRTITPQLAQKIPTPIFLKEDFLYFNTLFNYLKFYSYKGKFTYKNKELVVKQILNNSCLEKLNSLYLPKLRKIEPTLFTYDVLICPEQLNISQHVGSSLDWPTECLQIIINYLKSQNISYAIVVKNNKFSSLEGKIISPSIKEMLYLISQAKFLLAQDIDLLLIALSISNAVLFFSPLKDKRFCVKKHALLLRQEQNSVLNLQELNPLTLGKIISHGCKS